MELVRRNFLPPRGSFLLFGPRGTGKSTWLRQHLPDALYLDLLDPQQYRDYLAAPERLIELLDGNPQARAVVIDEVQKVPALLGVVHKLLERKDRHQVQFILTGSSARKLRHGGSDLLAGRLLLRTMHPFMAAELGDGFDLRRNMNLGMLPLVLGSPEPDQTLQSYVSLYLREEVQAEGLVRNLGDFSRFLEAISFSHGSMLNLSEVARECQVGRKTAEGYVAILEDLLLAFRIQPFTRRAKRHLVQHPKFFYMDAGVYQSVRPRGPLDKPEEIGGPAMEGLVAQHLRAWIAYDTVPRELFFWRTKSGSEVDFIVYGDDVFDAIEVKSARTVHSSDLASVRAFRADYPQARTCLLYGGQERRKIDGILCIPCEQFVRHVKPGIKLPLD